jgi:deoxyadenosine/deoxycytidine kinase
MAHNNFVNKFYSDGYNGYAEIIYIYISIERERERERECNI